MAVSYITQLPTFRQYDFAAGAVCPCLIHDVLVDSCTKTKPKPFPMESVIHVVPVNAANGEICTFCIGMNVN